MIQQNKGEEAEEKFMKLLRKENIIFLKVNTHIDFIIHGHEVDVKMTNISHKGTTKIKNKTYSCWRIGHFHMSKEQKKKSIFLALFVKINNHIEFLGIIKTRNHERKTYNLHNINNEKRYSIKEFQKLFC